MVYSPAAYLGLHEGDAHVIRNAGKFEYHLSRPLLNDYLRRLSVCQCLLSRDLS